MRTGGRLRIPSLTSAPGTAEDGEVYYNETDDKVYARQNGAWVRLGGEVLRTVHTFAVKGTIAGAADTTPSFFVSLASGQVTNTVKARYKVGTGTNVTFKIQKNGADWTGFGTTGSPLTATTTAATTTQANALAEDDEIDLVILGISGTPADLSVTLVLEHNFN